MEHSAVSVCVSSRPMQPCHKFVAKTSVAAAEQDIDAPSEGFILDLVVARMHPYRAKIEFHRIRTVPY